MRIPETKLKFLGISGFFGSNSLILGLFGSMASGDLDGQFSEMKVCADPLCSGSSLSAGNGVIDVDDDGVQITCFTENVHDVVLHFQIIRLAKQVKYFCLCCSSFTLVSQVSK